MGVLLLLLIRKCCEYASDDHFRNAGLRVVCAVKAVETVCTENTILQVSIIFVPRMDEKPEIFRVHYATSQSSHQRAYLLERATGELTMEVVAVETHSTVCALALLYQI